MGSPAITERPPVWRADQVPACPFDFGAFPNCARAWVYAQRVVIGLEPAGEFVWRAAARFFGDVTRGAWDLRPELAERAMIFAQLMPNIKGPLAGKPLTLLDWQAFVYLNVFAWTDDEGARRFRQAVVYVPRGNGKTTVAAPLGAYMTFIEGEGGAEGYAAAVTSDQARILFGTMQEMVRRTPELRDRFGVKAAANAIHQLQTASTFKPVSSDAKSLDGLNVHFAACDEIGSHKTSEVYDVLLTALGKRLQPFMLSISTATGNLTGIGRQLWRYVEKILRGQVDDDRLFGILYAADAEDDIWNPATWRKANPSWGVAVQPAAIEAIATQAKQNPAREAAFRTRHLNLWVGADDALFSASAWAALARPDWSREMVEPGRDCYVGLDLATKTDLAAIAYLWPPTESDPVWRASAQCFLPDAAVMDGRNELYVAWARDTALVVTPGDVTDFEAIEDALLEARDRWNVRAIAFDPWAASQLAQRMMAEGLPMLEFRAMTQNFSEPTKELDAMIRSGRIEHDGGGPLAWCLGNVVGHYDARGNVYPRKERPENKIDAAIALIMALGKAIFDVEDAESVYEGRGLVLL